MGRQRRILVVTGTRAEFGLLRPLLNVVAADPDLDLQIVATGAHLVAEQGGTLAEIANAGFTVQAQVDMVMASDTPRATAKAMALGVLGLADAFDRLKPDIVVVFGDRYEMLAAAQTALIMGLPIAHLAGGERTEGAFDDAIRHAITKLSHLHFVQTEAYAQRVAQMGEDPARIFVVGSFAADALRTTEIADVTELEAVLDLRVRDRRLFLVTYHPETLSPEGQAAAVSAMLAALDRYPDAAIVITGANSDPGHHEINAVLTAFANARTDRVRLVASLGQRRYFAALREAAVVVGNSSSGLMEAPLFGVPTVNIGQRQLGRDRPMSVIDCGPSYEEISAALAQALGRGRDAQLKHDDLQRTAPSASHSIARELRSTNLTSLRIKTFRDFPTYPQDRRHD